MKRKPVVALSLKAYYPELASNLNIAKNLLRELENSPLEFIYFPSLGAISQVAATLKNSNIGVGAQNIGPFEKGPYTGEYSILSLREVGGKYVEVGHSERRQLFKEDDQLIQQKVRLTLNNGLTPLLCVGEVAKLTSLNQRQAELERQLFLALQGLGSAKLSKIIIAYEPVWAIGQEEAASATYIHNSHQLIRQLLESHYGKHVSQKIRLIYGGSVSSENVAKIIDHVEVDGVFVGRFGHEISQLKAIVTAVENKG